MYILRSEGTLVNYFATEKEKRRAVGSTDGNGEWKEDMELLQSHSFTEVAAMTGMSRSTVTREARKRGIRKNER